ncbi:hypothetical protein PG993_006857 [Apiospora rasikravindrae]|uniref:Secreted protein n=1 Tax=Apiospora rasikravindrae TaxID=990691 RepID=A0ABR1SVT4_9PEZI
MVLAVAKFHVAFQLVDILLGCNEMGHHGQARSQVLYVLARFVSKEDFFAILQGPALHVPDRLLKVLLEPLA